jgi:hypothetical protein
VPGLEVPDVLPQRLGQLALGLAGLDVLALQPLDVLLVEHRRHRLDRLEEVADRLQVLVAVENPRLQRRGVRVVRERVPGAEDQVVERGQRHEVADEGRPPLGAPAEPNGAHLGERADRPAATPPHVLHTRDECRRHRTQADAQDSERSLRRRDPPGHLFSHC